MADDEIVPDDKDWTWVLEAPCPECGFDASAVASDDVPGLIRENAAAWSEIFDAPPDVLRRRPRPDRWSTLEYGAHVRDVHRLFHDRLQLMLVEDDPLFANWNQDETARAERYGDQDPAVVGTELVEAAGMLADAFAAVDSPRWQRPGRRSDGARFTIESFARYFLHDPIHHLWDVTAS